MVVGCLVQMPLPSASNLQGQPSTTGLNPQLLLGPSRTCCSDPMPPATPFPIPSPHALATWAFPLLTTGPLHVPVLLFGVLYFSKLLSNQTSGAKSNVTSCRELFLTAKNRLDWDLTAPQLLKALVPVVIYISLNGGLISVSFSRL